MSFADALHQPHQPLVPYYVEALRAAALVMSGVVQSASGTPGAYSAEVATERTQVMAGDFLVWLIEQHNAERRGYDQMRAALQFDVPGKPPADTDWVKTVQPDG